jgi:hypothetical protein
VANKFAELARTERYENVTALLADVASDVCSPGICVNAKCDDTMEVEPDQDRG